MEADGGAAAAAADSAVANTGQALLCAEQHIISLRCLLRVPGSKRVEIYDALLASAAMLGGDSIR